jgi:hypothetical protein
VAFFFPFLIINYFFSLSPYSEQIKEEKGKGKDAVRIERERKEPLPPPPSWDRQETHGPKKLS